MIKIAISTRYVSDITNGSRYRRFYTTFPYREIAEELDWLFIPFLSIQHIDEIADMCDALIIPGNSADVDPVNYGEELRPETNLYDFEVYSQDKAAIHAFNRLGKPILGICAGIQVINVVFGGSLHQHIEGHRDATHHVRLTRDSLLYRIYGKEDIMTNSYHHQCVNRVADGFKVTAMSEDGIVEGIEKDNILAVQWHPEISHDYDFFINWLKLSQTD